ncbi:MAG TPA: hypothetical protein VLB84_04995 [Bacteroidia bacterium]|nr:hypothetical protein [Bacteroidia bacterium]
MKNTLTISILVILSFGMVPCFAQDTTKAEGKTKEYVLTLSNISPLNVGIRYKKQLKNRMFFKVGLINLNASISDNKPFSSSMISSKYYSFSGGMELGLEFRRGLGESFTFFHGPNVNVSSVSKFARYADPSNTDSKMQTQYVSNSLGVRYTLGILLHLKGHFFMSAEINPGVFMTYSRDEKNYEMYSPSLGFGNSFSLISLVYRR